jgi:hypothetical protein
LAAFSNASLASVAAVSDPGPMLFWVLAFQARFLGDWALPVTMGDKPTYSYRVAWLTQRRSARRW